MKRFKLTYIFLLAVALPLLTACTNDDVTGEGNTLKDGKVTVRLRISQAAPAVTRAGTATKDPNANEDELMNIWTVIVTDEEGSVKHILTCEPAEDDREIDPIETDIDLEPDTYKFYSFANIGARKLETLLGFDEGTIPGTNGATVVEEIPTTSITFPATGNTLDNYTAKIDGNCFNPSADENGFGSKGIPMSNFQTITVSDTKKVIDLIVVRMLAKIEFWLYNDYEEDLKIKSITLTDITENASNNAAAANLKLFPRYTINTPNGANEKVDYKHGDIHPNLIDNATTENLIIYPTSDGAASLLESTPNTWWTIKATENKYDEESNGTPKKDKAKVISFYINESATPTNDFKHFFLELEVEGDEHATIIGGKNLRYAMIGDVGKTYDDANPNEWNYIARNDYRIIPIVLDDYKLDMIPYDFPAIGVYPASMKEENGIYTINFHDYGHFHLVPQVTKYSDGSTVPYIDQKETETTTYWTIGGRNESTASKKLSELTSVWGSWTDASKEKKYDNEDPGTYPGYFNGKAFYNTGFSSTVDDSEKGGDPVWYQNKNNVNPTWSADANYSGPFIFGYINKHPNGTGDRKVYHEFSINLYKGDTAPRQMTYRLYMILDEGQMLPATSRGLGASAPRHTHHSH